MKIDNPDEATEYGINKLPSLLYFEKGIPTLYEGNLEDEEKVLKWLEHQQKSDQIEDITDEMLDMVIEKMPHVAVLFCKCIGSTILFNYSSVYIFLLPFKVKEMISNHNSIEELLILIEMLFADDKDQKKSQKVLSELENIDDDCDSHNIAFVKIDNTEEAKEYGIDELPCLVLFEKRIPHVYDGNIFSRIAFSTKYQCNFILWINAFH